MDAYIDRIRARTRQAAGIGGGSKSEGSTSSGTALPQTANKSTLKSNKEGSQRLLAVVKAIAKSGKSSADEDGDDEDAEDDEYQQEIEL